MILTSQFYSNQVAEYFGKKNKTFQWKTKAMTLLAKLYKNKFKKVHIFVCIKQN